MNEFDSFKSDYLIGEKVFVLEPYSLELFEAQVISFEDKHVQLMFYKIHDITIDTPANLVFKKTPKNIAFYENQERIRSEREKLYQTYMCSISSEADMVSQISIQTAINKTVTENLPLKHSLVEQDAFFHYIEDVEPSIREELPGLQPGDYIMECWKRWSFLSSLQQNAYREHLNSDNKDDAIAGKVLGRAIYVKQQRPFVKVEHPNWSTCEIDEYNQAEWANLTKNQVDLYSLVIDELMNVGSKSSSPSANVAVLQDSPKLCKTSSLQTSLIMKRNDDNSSSNPEDLAVIHRMFVEKNAFIHFLHSIEPELQRANPDMNSSALINEAWKQWISLDEEIREEHKKSECVTKHKYSKYSMNSCINSYTIFVSQKQHDILSKDTNISKKELINLIQTLWHSMSNDEKQIYKEIAKSINFFKNKKCLMKNLSKHIPSQDDPIRVDILERDAFLNFASGSHKKIWKKHQDISSHQEVGELWSHWSELQEVDKEKYRNSDTIRKKNYSKYSMKTNISPYNIFHSFTKKTTSDWNALSQKDKAYYQKIARELGHMKPSQEKTHQKKALQENKDIQHLPEIEGSSFKEEISTFQEFQSSPQVNDLCHTSKEASGVRRDFIEKDAFIDFLHSAEPELREEKPEFSPPECINEIWQQWLTLSEEAKEEYRKNGIGKHNNLSYSVESLISVRSVFISQNRYFIRKIYPEKTKKEVDAIVSLQWQELPDDEKNIYREIVKAMKEFRSKDHSMKKKHNPKRDAQIRADFLERDAFFEFFSVSCNDIILEHPGISGPYQVQEAWNRWSQLSEQEREKYRNNESIKERDYRRFSIYSKICSNALFMTLLKSSFSEWKSLPQEEKAIFSKLGKEFSKLKHSLPNCSKTSRTNTVSVSSSQGRGNNETKVIESTDFDDLSCSQANIRQPPSPIDRNFLVASDIEFENKDSATNVAQVLKESQFINSQETIQQKRTSSNCSF